MILTAEGIDQLVATGKVDPATVDVPVVRDLYGLLDMLELERDGVEPLVGY